MTAFVPLYLARRLALLLAIGAVMLAAAVAVAAPAPAAAPGSAGAGDTALRAHHRREPGGAGRVPLRYAATDARAMQHVLTELGGLGETSTDPPPRRRPHPPAGGIRTAPAHGRGGGRAPVPNRDRLLLLGPLG